MLHREVKRVKNKVEKYLDPFGILALILLFVLPALAVLNLSPESNRNLAMNRNVLGESDGGKLGFVLVGGVHDYFKDEVIDFPQEDIVNFSTSIIKHSKGTYSKPVLVVENDNSKASKLTVTGSLTSPADSEVSLIFDKKYYRLVSANGEPFTVNIEVPAKSNEILYLHLNTLSDTAFNNSMELSIVQN